jgi:hypothetical protein
MSKSICQPEPCAGCGGTSRYYDGALGYEAYVCEQCGEHWADKSKEEYEKHIEDYKKGVRNGLTPFCVVTTETFTRTSMVNVFAASPEKALENVKEQLCIPDGLDLEGRDFMVRDTEKGGSTLGFDFYRVYLVESEGHHGDGC